THEHPADHVGLRNAVAVVRVAETLEPVEGVIERVVNAIAARVPEAQRRDAERIDDNVKIRAGPRRTQPYGSAGALRRPGVVERRSLRVRRIARRFDDKALEGMIARRAPIAGRGRFAVDI